MASFFIFYAPFIVIAGAIAVAFWVAPKDNRVK